MYTYIIVNNIFHNIIEYILFILYLMLLEKKWYM